MARTRRARRPSFLRRSTTIVVPLAALALVLGYIGLRAAVRGHHDLGHSTVDLLYYDAQLFVLSSPPVDGGTSFSLALQIARFLAPFITVFTIFEAGRRIFASELALHRLRRTREHDIVCGSGPLADALVGRLLREGRRVVRIVEHGAPVGRGPGAWAVGGDPTSGDVLQSAGIGRARALYACTTDAPTNLAVAQAITAIERRAGGALDVHVEVDDPELCAALQARRLGLPSSPSLHVNFFSAHELAARTLARVHAPPLVEGRPARVLVIGASPFGVCLIVELARQWHSDPARHGTPLDAILVDPNASGEISRLVRRYPPLASSCRFTAYDVNIARLLDGDLPHDEPDRVYLCADDEETSLKLALTMDQFWHRGPRTVVVRLSRLGPVGQAFHSAGAPRLLDDVSGSLFLFDAVRAGSDSDLADDSLVERLGRAVHEGYLAARIRDGQPVATLRPWSELTEQMRLANRAQAADVGRKLRAVGCALAPSPIWGPPVEFDDDDIERLAAMEHARWHAFMLENGWRNGPVRDDEAKIHPDLEDWSRLNPAAREKDREAIRSMPDYLADAGFQIVRVGPETPATVTAVVPRQRAR